MADTDITSIDIDHEKPGTVMIEAGTFDIAGMMLMQAEQCVEVIAAALSEGVTDSVHLDGALACVRTQIKAAVDLLDSEAIHA